MSHGSVKKNIDIPRAQMHKEWNKCNKMLSLGKCVKGIQELFVSYSCNFSVFWNYFQIES